MTQQICAICGQDMDDGARFCSACGGQLQAAGRICEQCRQSNPESAHFCMNCGEGLTAQEIAAVDSTAIHHLANAAAVPLTPSLGQPVPTTPSVGQSLFTQKNLAVMAIILLFLAAAGGGYYYYTQQMTQRFLSASSLLAGQLAEADARLGSQFEQPIDAQFITTLKQDWPGQIEELQAAVDEWKAVKCPNQYLPQKQLLDQVGEIQLAILGQIPDILAHPLAAETDDGLESLRQNMEKVQDLSETLQLPGVRLSHSSQAAAVADRLSAYCSEQREIYKAKLARLEAMTTYFNQMDSILQKNSEAKTGLGAMLGKIRNGEYGWPDYFKMIDGAKSTRESLRNQVNRLVTPAGTEEYTAELSRLLSLSINYCDIMKAGATSESKGDYEAANRKYIEAQTLNDQIQSQYSAFTSKYQNGKTALTNIDNL